jgi:hypothetical protein
VRDIFQRMQEILTQEQDSRVREGAMTTIFMYGQAYFPMFKDIVPHFKEEETEKIVEKLLDIYLEQRRKDLPAGDRPFYKDDYENPIPIWKNPAQRPRTQIERELLAWIHKPEHTITQQIAFRALIRFRREFNEEDFIRILQEQDAASTPAKRAKRKVNQPVQKPTRKNGLYPRTLLLYGFIPWIVTINAPHLRKTIRGVLPEAFYQHISSPDSVKALLNDLIFISDKITDKVAYRLRRAIFLADWAIVMLGITVMIMIGIIISLVSGN